MDARISIILMPYCRTFTVLTLTLRVEETVKTSTICILYPE